MIDLFYYKLQKSDKINSEKAHILKNIANVYQYRVEITQNEE